ncbi:MAG: CvpA family protein, partial [Rhodospirillaceae bacterium]|nr:CvpA family protein [Rhodospirillaceae bacterium]
MTMFDVAVIAVLAVSGVLAIARGFVHEVLSIVGWVGAFFATMYATPLLKPLMMQVIEDEFF